MNKDITRVQETIRKLRAVMTAVSDIAYESIVFKPEDAYAEYLLELTNEKNHLYYHIGVNGKYSSLCCVAKET